MLIVMGGMPCASLAAVPAETQGNMVPSLAATIEAMPKNLPRAAAPNLDEAMRAARAAVQRCSERGAKVSVLIADVKARPVVLLSGDGAGFRSQLIAQTKANIVARFHMSSEEAAQKAKHDPNIAQQAAQDQGIGMLRGGGLPIRAGKEWIGIAAVSGAGLTGDLTLDEQCARVAVSLLERPQ